MSESVLKLCRYLGDGVYAGHDGHQVWIYTEEGKNMIALEAEVFRNLVDYAGAAKRLIAAHGKDALKRGQL